MAQSPNDAGSVVRLSITSDGALLDDAIHVVSVTVHKRINAIPIARIVIEDGDVADKDFAVSNADTFKPGKKIVISAGYDEDEEPIFTGIVVKHGVRVTGSADSQLVLECRDAAVAMTIGRRNANYVDSTDSDIITGLIGRHAGLSSDVEATTTTFKELVQYYCTDWDYMLARAEVNGLLVMVDAGSVAVKSPDGTTEPVLKVTFGEDMIEFDAEMDARSQLTSVDSVSWDPKTQAIVTGTKPPATVNDQGDIAAAALAKAVGSPDYRMQTAAPVESSALLAWSGARQMRAALARIRGRMSFMGSAKAVLGSLIETAGVGNRFAGNVFVSSILHEIAAGGWTTEVEFGMTADWFIERKDVVSPLASGWTAGVTGLDIGVVKKLDASPNDEPMIQVSVPLMGAEADGVWARLTKFYGSDGIGAFFIPEIGDEVILGYLNGDPSFPVILGSVYSSKRKPPYPLTAENNTKAIVTRSKLTIEFEEEKKVITIITPGQNKIVIDDDQKSILLLDQNDNKVELSPSGIVMDSPKDIKITAKGTITVDAVGKVSISSKADVTTAGLNISNEAQVGFVAKGSATAELSASGQTTVKGAMVMIN